MSYSIRVSAYNAFNQVQLPPLFERKFNSWEDFGPVVAHCDNKREIYTAPAQIMRILTLRDKAKSKRSSPNEEDHSRLGRLTRRIDLAKSQPVKIPII